MSQGIWDLAHQAYNRFMSCLTGGALGLGHLWTLLTVTFTWQSFHIFQSLWLRSIGLINAHIFGPARFINILHHH